MPEGIGDTWISGFDAFAVIWKDVEAMRRNKEAHDRRQPVSGREEKGAAASRAPRCGVPEETDAGEETESAIIAPPREGSGRRSARAGC